MTRPPLRRRRIAVPHRSNIVVFLIAPVRRRTTRAAYPLVLRGSWHSSAAGALRKAKAWKRGGYLCWIARLPGAAINPKLKPLGGW